MEGNACCTYSVSSSYKNPTDAPDFTRYPNGQDIKLFYFRYYCAGLVKKLQVETKLNLNPAILKAGYRKSVVTDSKYPHMQIQDKMEAKDVRFNNSETQKIKNFFM